MDLPEEVYTYWDELDVIVELSYDIHKKIAKNELRDFIIRAISKGVLDDPSGDGKKMVRRHALTVNEIVDNIAENQGREVKKSNLYYHLQVLTDLGIIQEVATVKDGNITTSYFGRTSKLIMMKPEEEDRKKHEVLEENDDFAIFLKRMQEKHDTQYEVDKLITDMTKLREILSQNEGEFKDWIRAHAMELRGLDLDLIKLFYLYIEVKKITPTLISVYETLDDILQIRN